MEHGFIKAAAVTPKIKVADPAYNCEEICKGIKEAYHQGARLIVFPELCLSGYTCDDLFHQERLLSETKQQLQNIIEYTEGYEGLVFVGLPFEKGGKLYNVAAVISDGRLLALIPKRNIPNYGEFYEARHFHAGPAETADIFVDGEYKMSLNCFSGGGWNNNNVILIIDEKEAAEHTVEIRMKEGQEDKTFTILCFGYTQ